MPAPASPAPFHCRNCGHPRADRFCARCGQDSRDHSRELRELLRDFAEHVLALDLKSLRSFKALILEPGRLTLDWAQGRRVTWVSPFRLYLASSFIFYIALWLSGLALMQIVAVPLPPAEIQAMHMTPHPDGTPIYEFEPAMLTPPVAPLQMPPVSSQKLHDWAADIGLPRLATLFERVLADPSRLNEAADIWMPRLLFALVPLCACLFALFRARRPLLFLDHLTFALHLQSFIFLLSAAMMPIWARTDSDIAGYVPGALIAGYGALAHRRVYGNALWVSAIKVLIVLTIYLVTLALGLLFVALAALWPTLT